MSDYEYKKRRIPLDRENQFRFGEGKISGYVSVSLGVMSLLAVFAYLYPSYLTTTELRQVYDAHFLQQVLKYGMYFALFFGVLTFILGAGRYRKMGLTGIALTLIAFLLGGYQIPIGPVEPRELSLGVDWLILALLGSVFIFISLEKLFPKYRNQVILRDGWSVDLFYFTFNHLAISAILMYANYHVTHFDWAVSPFVQDAVNTLPFIIQLGLVVICADFVLYWEHRLYHEVGILWPIHAVHHSVETLDWLAGSRGHFIQVFSERAMVMVPLYLLGVSENVLNAYVIFAALQAVLIHCNVGFSFGFLRFIFVTPQFHHWHHSSEKPAIDTNYSAHTILFDWLFKTMHMPDNHWPIEYGTTKPLPKTVIGQVLYPIKSLFKKS